MAEASNTPSPTHEFRLAVVNHLEQNGMASALGRFFPGVYGGVSITKRMNIYHWAKRRVDLER
ncbi:hypothetical protein PybrP1_009011 [[Pythium] brassicae (nom. inval.)]|nr:hypothetical protein PybrP1_009011 [[Pythium] brassicae (nom. inval.)]